MASNKPKTAAAEQWNGPAYIFQHPAEAGAAQLSFNPGAAWGVDGQGTAWGVDGPGKTLGVEIVAQQFDSLRHEFKESMQMIQSTWGEQRERQQDGWYTKEQWGEHMRSQWEERQWDEDKWSQREDPQWDQQRRSTRQTRNEWGGWKWQ